MIYLIVTISSLLITLNFFINSRSIVYNKSNSLFIQEIISTINMHTVYDSSKFSLFIPENMCSAVFSGHNIIYKNISYVLNSNIKLGSNIFCNSTNKTVNVSLNKIAPNEFLLT
jgi:hypothetical protein